MPAQYMVAGACASSSGTALTLDCPKCKQRLPLSSSTYVGSTLWCVKDKQSYAALCMRWAKVSALKVWWNALTAIQQAEWFGKWQRMTPKERFEAIQYVEKTSYAAEDIEDELERFKTWSTYKNEGLAAGLKLKDLEKDWQDVIDTNRDECMYRRGQWLIPEFVGVERRGRKRRTEEIASQRQSHVGDQRALDSMWAAGKTRVDRYQDSLPQSVMSLPEQAPVVHSSAVDMPKRPDAQSVLYDNISREVGGDKQGGCDKTRRRGGGRDAC